MKKNLLCCSLFIFAYSTRRHTAGRQSIPVEEPHQDVIKGRGATDRDADRAHAMAYGSRRWIRAVLLEIFISS